VVNSSRQRHSPSRRVIVVGGGLAGIAGALACADAGATVTLYESRRSLGGGAASSRRGDLEVDVGQHVFLRCCGAYRWLLNRLGSSHLTQLQGCMDIHVLHPDGRRGRLRRDHLPAPLHLTRALAAYPFLSPSERGRAMLAALNLRRLDGADARLDEQTFGSWLAAHGQTANAIASLWDLIGLSTLNLHADEASLLLATRVFQTGLLEHEAAGDIGMSSVPLSQLHAEPAMNALRRAGVEIRLRTAVRSVLGDGDVEGVATTSGERRADAVILAVPPDRVAGLLPAQAVADVTVFARLGASAIVSAHVVYDRPVMPVAFFAALDSPVQWAFDRSRAASLPHGRYVVVTLSGADDLLRQSSTDLREQLLPALAELLPAARAARVERFMVTRDQAATFRQSPGSARLRPGARTAMPGLYLAGAYTDTGWPATMEGAVQSGLRAAAEALRATSGVPLGRPA
jgi:squalene-associated FAD-dependent desaturase